MYWFTVDEVADLELSAALAEQERIVRVLEESDSACSGWAVALIRGETMSHTVDQPDMGYTTGFYDGKKAEQERIIKLLEHMPRTDNDRTIDAPTLIELIKGENK